jgi:glycosyltransferase involved in cell wall biosynthesis
MTVKSLRILIVHDYGTLHGGAEVMSVSLRDGLRRMGHSSRLFTSSARRFDLPIVSDDCCFGTTGQLRRVLQVWNPLATRALANVLHHFRPDVVHLRMFMTQLSPAILRTLRGVPTLLHVVNHDVVCPITTKVLPDGSPCSYQAGVACWKAGCVSTPGLARIFAQRALLRRFRPAIDHVIANSRATAEELEEDGIPVDAVVWNGVSPAPARPDLQDPPTVFAGNRLVPEKGMDVLLEAFATALATVPTARLQIAGDGPARADLTQLGNSLGIGDRVEFLGHLPQPEMESIAARAWVQAVPSRWAEPFGLAAAEALMRGTAVIASNTGGLGELIEDGVTGIQVPPGSVADLRDALVALLGDRARADAIGMRGRRFALAELTEQRMLERFVDLYHRLLPTASPHA